MSTSSAITLQLNDLADCQKLAVVVAQSASAPLHIELIGTLGAGKTQWTRFFVEAMGGEPAEVSSPTFVLVKKYQTRLPIFHLDLYRLRDEDELLELGLEEMLDEDAIVLIEWADRFPDVMPRDKLVIELALLGDSSAREATIRATGAAAKQALEAIRRSGMEPLPP